MFCLGAFSVRPPPCLAASPLPNSTKTHLPVDTARYTLHTRLLVSSPSKLSWPVATAIFIVGLAGVLLNFWADHQRQVPPAWPSHPPLSTQP